MKKIILGMAACAALCACSSDDLLTDNGVLAEATQTADVVDGVYMKFSLSVGTATATRSTTTSEAGDEYVTSSEGVEIGKSYENNVGNVLVVLTDENGDYITSGTNASPVAETTADNNDTYIVSFKSEELSVAGGTNVKVYVYCNPESSLLNDSFDEDATYTLTSATDGTPWASNAIFMSSATEHLATLPADLTAHMVADNPIDLGTVKVERSVARFDYKDGSASGDYTYTIVKDEQGNALVNVQLEEVALINLSKSFYHLRRVAPDNSGGGKADLTGLYTQVLGTETSNNWVLDTDAADKFDYDGSDLSGNFYCALSTPGYWQWTSFAEISEADNDDTWNTEDYFGSYNIWRYATENTIPGQTAQRKGITTGVAFKAKMMIPASSPYYGEIDGTEPIYVYEGVLYKSWAAVSEAAYADATSSMYAAVKHVEATNWNGDRTTRTTAVSEAMAEVGFTSFTPDSNGDYYIYYYYWNRHNDNGKDGVMGTMEFGVVRNNVYKLSVTDITGFGHPYPNDPDDPSNPNDPDPDPENPDDPDEEQNYYFVLDVQILPWVVRVNDIQLTY